jgi:hypothetical protein
VLRLRAVSWVTHAHTVTRIPGSCPRLCLSAADRHQPQSVTEGGRAPSAVSPRPAAPAGSRHRARAAAARCARCRRGGRSAQVKAAASMARRGAHRRDRCVSAGAVATMSSRAWGVSLLSRMASECSSGTWGGRGAAWQQTAQQVQGAAGGSRCECLASSTSGMAITLC